MQEYEAHASTVPIIAIISILITLLGPRLLEKEDIMDYQSISMHCSITQSACRITEGWPDSLDCQIPKQWDGMRGITEWVVDPHKSSPRKLVDVQAIR